MLKSFWQGVHHIVSEFLQYNFNFTCLSFYLGNIDTELPKKDRYLLKIFMAASKKAITRRWLNTEPPTVNQWEAKNDYDHIAVM